MKMNPHIFREYDIRGVADKDFDAEFAYALARAAATHGRKYGFGKACVGRDCRLTGPGYAEAVINGFKDSGIEVIDLGVCPSPVFYFSVIHFGTDGGIMITASHNPPDQNGFKIHMGGGTIYGAEILEVKKVIEGGNFVPGKGSSTERDIITPYKKFISENIKLERGLNVAVDAGNGTAGPIAPDVLRSLGCTVTELYCDMDGTFPNHHPDPTVEENVTELIKTVKEKHLDMGTGFDGDADRIGVVTDKGKLLFGDRLLVIFARELLERKPGATIIGEVKCSRVLFEDIEKRGGNAIMWKAGHSLIKAKMKEVGAELAGEMSGHMFFKDRFFGYDDAIYAACRLAEILSKTDKSITEILSDLPETHSTPEIRVEVPDDIKFDLVASARKHFGSMHKTIDVDGVRILFDDGAWGLIRASNTQPALVLRFEADTAERLEEIKSYVHGELEGLRERLESGKR